MGGIITGTQRSLNEIYTILGGEDFRQVPVHLSGSFNEKIGALITAGDGTLDGRILPNMGSGMTGYKTLDDMPTIHLRRRNSGSQVERVPVPLWAYYSSHTYGHPPVLEIFARTADLEFVREELAKLNRR